MPPLSLSHPILAPLDRCLTLGAALLNSGQGTRGVTYIHSSAEHERVGYAELGRRAINTLGFLQHGGVAPGDTVVLVTEDLALFTAVFWACALGGIVVAPIATPANEDGHAKLANVIDALPGVWLASDHAARVSARLREGSLAPGHLLAIDRTMFAAAPGRMHADAGLDDVVLLQFSSGSTGHPKGVQITSRNLLANTSGFVQRCQLAADRDLMLNWMPLTHDFGIVFCHVLPVLFGIEQALIPTMVFMRHPLMWMQKASELGATVSAGPNYAYQHFLKRFRPDQDHGWDLSRLRLVINGAEPISCELSRSFFEALHRYGLSPLAATPGYGLAEATLMVTLNRPEVPFESIVLDRYRLSPGTRLARLAHEHPDAIECANVGPASDNVELRITDAHRQPVADEVIGTIETRGACVTLGYHGMPELNQATISAQGWLDTGDLGFISGGHLYITGRRKDLVIINGANYYPHDIENIAAQVPPLDLNMVLACAIPLPEQNREGLAIFVRTRFEGEAFFALADRVRDHVLQSMGVPVDHCLPVQQIPKTTSGKLRRFLLSQQFQAGEFDTDVQAAREHSVRSQLRVAWDRGEPVAFREALVAEAARLAPWADWTDPETARAPLMELGFGSLRIVEFLNRLNLALQQQWPVSMMFDHASVERLAEHLLAERHARSAQEPTPTPLQAQVQVEVPDVALPVVQPAGGDIAIIGLGCRFPGDANTPEDFWNLLVEARDATGPFPSDRWNPAFNAAATTDRGAYLQGLDRFDHRFFRLTPVEAERLDPQQRLLLTVSWEAFENAGLDPLRLKGSDTGVFTGISGSDYAQAEARSANLSDIGPYAFSGSATSIASGRLSFFYGFEGPNVALDTACSSALSALHWAVRALRAGECDLALASAVNLILSPEMQVGLSRMNALSPDGCCRTFDAAANGYARGEGCASVVIKRLEDALRDGDPIRAVIKGSAMNHDGASNGLTAPNGRAQEKVIRAALRDAGLAPGDIDYVEAHGTGTALGDPVEVMALAAAYGHGRGAEHPLWVGSVKTNVAHLEAAAGMASLCKVVAALQHGTLPPTLHLTQPNPMIPWDRVPVRVVDRVMPWPAGSPDRPRRAGLSAFGMSGTNVHLLLEAAPARSAPVPDHPQEPLAPVLVALSARTESALVEAAHRHAAWLRAHPDQLADLARTLACHRARFPVRQSVVGREAAEVAQALERIAPARRPSSSTAPAVVWVFPGQGSQQAGAVRDLIDREPVFRAALEQAQQVLGTWLPRPLLDLLQQGSPEELAETEVTQPVIVACGLALAALWRSWGIRPQAVLGHSVGEITAAAVAGAITSEAALQFAAERGALMQRLPAGAMLAVACGEAQVREVLLACGADLSIAAINGPRSLTLSGTPEAVETAAGLLAARGLRHSRLDVTRAFHSAMMDPVLTALQAAAQRLQPTEPAIALHSGLTGERVDAALLSQPDFWSRHARQPVRYHDALMGVSLPGAVHMELGTRPVLATLAAVHLPDTPWLTCADGAAQMSAPVLASLGRAHDLGCDVDWPAVFRHRPGRFADVPLHPFQGSTPMLSTVHAEISPPATAPVLAPALAPVPLPTPTPVPAAAPTATPHAAVQAALRRIVRNVAGLQDEDITPDANWFALGLDSLLVLQLQLALCKDFDVDIKLNDVFEQGTTLDDLTALVASRLPADSPLRTPLPTMPAVPVVVPVVPVASAVTPVAPAAALPMPGGDVEALLARQIDALSNLFRQQLSVLQGLGVPVTAPVVTPPPAIPVTPVTKAAEPVTPPPTREIKGLYKKIPGQKADWSADKLAHVHRLATDYNARTTGSKRITAEGRAVYANPRAVIGFRPEWKELTYPLHVDRADGAHVWDVDGNRYVDITMGFGATLLGHNPPCVREAVAEELLRGAPLGPQTPHALRVARLLADMTGNERVGFFTTGSEAVMVAARLARAVTQRSRIVIFTNAYHGTFDGFLAMGWVDDGQPRTYPLADGTPARMVEDVVVLRYGDPRSLEVIRGMAHELAAVLVEPVQSRDPLVQPAEFLRELRQITADSGTALVFDEMIMGFRVHPGGAQHHFGIQADICTYGKIVGGGLPIGVVAGKARFLDAIDGGAWQYGDDSVPSARTAFVAGTFNSHPLSMAAAAAVLTHLREAGPALQERLNARTADLAARLNTVFEQEQAPIRCVQFSSLFRFEFAEDTEVLNYHLLRQGVFVWEGRNCFLSTAHSDEDIDFLVQAVRQGVRSMRAEGYLSVPAVPPQRVVPAVVPAVVDVHLGR